MCVIAVVTKDDKRPNEEMVSDMYKRNHAGAGIAWRDKGYVQFLKGLSLEQIQPLIAKLPVPFVAHFRIPTVGGDNQALCHPFLIDKKAGLPMKGKTKGSVLFHNGHWNEWKKTALDTAKSFAVPLPAEGAWSDSRAMAFCASVYGLGFLEMIDEKSVVLGPNTLEVFNPAQWDEYEGFWVSNKQWTGGRTSYFRTAPASILPTIITSGGPIAVNRILPSVTGPTTLIPDVKKDDAWKTGGSSQQVPFDPATMTLADAARLFRQNRMSRKQFKKAQKQFRTDILVGETKAKQQKLIVKHLQ